MVCCEYSEIREEEVCEISEKIRDPYFNSCLLSGVKLAETRVFLGQKICSVHLDAIRLVCQSGSLEITFDQAKNYNKWDCTTSCIAKNQEVGFDPVQIIRSYLEELGGDESQWLFPAFKKGKKDSVVFINSPVSFDTMLKLLREGLDMIGQDGKRFSLHSVKTGAVSEAVDSGS